MFKCYSASSPAGDQRQQDLRGREHNPPGGDNAHGLQPYPHCPRGVQTARLQIGKLNEGMFLYRSYSLCNLPSFKLSLFFFLSPYFTLFPDPYLGLVCLRYFFSFSLFFNGLLFFLFMIYFSYFTFVMHPPSSLLVIFFSCLLAIFTSISHTLLYFSNELPLTITTNNTPLPPLPSNTGVCGDRVPPSQW